MIYIYIYIHKNIYHFRSFSRALFGGYTFVAQLFDSLSDSVPVTPVEIIPDMRKRLEVEVTTAETRAWKKMIIGVDSRQDETLLSEIRSSQIASPSERDGGDDWPALFDILREKPVVVPPGTKRLHGRRLMRCTAKMRYEVNWHQMYFPLFLLCQLLWLSMLWMWWQPLNKHSSRKT